MTWDRAQQRWSNSVSNDDTAVPMEVDRIEGKDWHNGGKKGKGKGKQDKGELPKERPSPKESPKM